jgi:hypothetical protein
MKTDKTETLKIKLKGEEITQFKSAIEKINDADSKIGFKGLLNDDEKKVIKDIQESIKA